ncbi:ubiquinol-cytochrome c reductase iron-sulfur subunit [SCandidatus Aminicenantes bacterium Aminicenantia_JdfR_composite]|jgi:Rieske Fe-S protein|nr:ubiquinol-cytochrome c reductase iron-sulfur subunit [SCandidatus Aminicenantes bacterium Aminicenantia_JdfR_composite]MCP2597757.1 ubiquinol-cytochrome c reductase iron-sulfur subunit [Candidatus Aminicenantes bacterium AC-335-L06]MCP2605911.1 ubiquinol-cytochrome c reductase iron-sulfur subunit [Candidatus Aminicenantes bacterium AC-335-O07]
MRLKYSILSRRKFLNFLLGGWAITFFSTLLYPIIKFIFPPYKEPEEVILPLAEFKDMSLYSAKNFSWGSKPGILLRKEGGFVAFIGVCTHFDCNVSWLPDQKKFFCACHNGWYDENGINIAGPPPAPLPKLNVEIDGENIIIKRWIKA